MLSAPGAPASTTGTSFRWSNLPNGTEQQFQVRAKNRDADWGAWSPASAAVKPCGVPDAPGAPAAARGDKQAVVTWGAPGDQGCAITGYEVRTSTGSQAANGSPYTFTGLTNGTAYSFTRPGPQQRRLGCVERRVGDGHPGRRAAGSGDDHGDGDRRR